MLEEKNIKTNKNGIKTLSRISLRLNIPPGVSDDYTLTLRLTGQWANIHINVHSVLKISQSLSHQRNSIWAIVTRPPSWNVLAVVLL